jgi:hypothetical protein
MKKIVLISLLAFPIFETFGQTLKYNVRAKELNLTQELDSVCFGKNNKRKFIMTGKCKANTSLDKDSATIHINYWLDDIIPLQKDQKIETLGKVLILKINQDELSTAHEMPLRGCSIGLATFNAIKDPLESLYLLQAATTDAYKKLKKSSATLLELKDALTLINDLELLSKDTALLFRKRAQLLNLIAENDIDSKNYEKKVIDCQKALKTYLESLKACNVEWFPVDADKVFLVKDSNNNIVSVYGVQYDRTSDYTYKLANRQFKRFFFSSWEATAVTIPFKCRFQFTKNNLSVPDEFSADLNVGAFISRSFGTITYKHIKSGNSSPNIFKFSVGPFGNISRMEVDSSNTYADKIPLSSKRTIGTFSTGAGIMVAAYGFRFGTFFGWDIGFGNVAKKWNYNQQPWLGFGIGYTLGTVTFSGK